MEKFYEPNESKEEENELPENNIDNFFYSDKEESEQIDHKLDSFFETISARFKRLQEVDKQDKLAVKLLMSEDFMKGETLVHESQITYIKEMIDSSDDESFRNKLQKKLELIEKSFLILQILHQEAISVKDEIHGNGKKKGEAIVMKMAAFFYPAGAGVVGGAVSGLGEASLVLAGVLGVTGLATNYIIGEIRKYQLMKKNIALSKGTLDFSDDQESDLFQYLKSWEEFYQKQSKSLSDALEDLKIWNEYYQNKSDRRNELSSRRIADEELRVEREKHEKYLEQMNNFYDEQATRIRNAKTLNEIRKIANQKFK